MNKSLQILDIKSVAIDTQLFNVTAINQDCDPYWVEFIKPHFDEINVDIKILPLTEINKDKTWFINVDINSWNWPSCQTDVFKSFGLEILSELNHGNAYVILNHQCESFTKSFFDTLYQKLKNFSGIPYNKIIYMVAAADASREYKNFVKERNLSKDQEITVMYAHHVYKRFRHDTPLSFFNYDRTIKKEKKFLSLNRRWHDHRLLLVCGLAYDNLIEHGYVSLGVSPEEVAQAQQTVDNLDRQYRSKYIKLGFDKIKNRLPLQVDMVDLRINQFQTTSLPIEFYQKSCFSLVSSTCALQTREKSVGFTEKEIKPILARHPFIIHNLAGALTHLKNMGFLTFERWFDESYDEETNDNNRLIKIIDEVKRLSELSFEQWDIMLEEMAPVLEHNYNRLVNYTTEHCYFNSDLKKLLYYVS
jgi:hypothetical protein